MERTACTEVLTLAKPGIATALREARHDRIVHVQQAAAKVSLLALVILNYRMLGLLQMFADKLDAGLMCIYATSEPLMPAAHAHMAMAALLAVPRRQTAP